jgi:hypothetical protein
MAMFMLPGFRLSEGEAPEDPVLIRFHRSVFSSIKSPVTRISIIEGAAK